MACKFLDLLPVIISAYGFLQKKSKIQSISIDFRNFEEVHVHKVVAMNSVKPMHICYGFTELINERINAAWMLRHPDDPSIHAKGSFTVVHRASWEHAQRLL